MTSVQAAFLPALPNLNDYDMLMYSPMSGVSGFLYTTLQRQAHGSASFDVSGHGISSAC